MPLYSLYFVLIFKGLEIAAQQKNCNLCVRRVKLLQESVPVTLGYTFPFHIYSISTLNVHIHNGRRGLNYMYKTCLKNAAFCIQEGKNIVTFSLFQRRYFV